MAFLPCWCDVHTCGVDKFLAGVVILRKRGRWTDQKRKNEAGTMNWSGSGDDELLITEIRSAKMKRGRWHELIRKEAGTMNWSEIDSFVSPRSRRSRRNREIKILSMYSLSTMLYILFDFYICSRKSDNRVRPRELDAPSTLELLHLIKFNDQTTNIQMTYNSDTIYGTRIAIARIQT
jgi:hypothetical protein